MENVKRYGSEPIEGLTVWGKWDSELYVKHNENVEGEHGWSHFRSEFLMHRGTHPSKNHNRRENILRRCDGEGDRYMTCASRGLPGSAVGGGKADTVVV